MSRKGEGDQNSAASKILEGEKIEKTTVLLPANYYGLRKAPIKSIIEKLGVNQHFVTPLEC